MPETALPPPNDGGVDPTDVDIAEAFQPPDNLDHTPDPLAAAKPPPVDEAGGTIDAKKDQEHITEKAAEEQGGNPEEVAAARDQLAEEGPTKTEEDKEMVAADLPVEEPEMPMGVTMESHRHSNINNDYAGAATGVWSDQERRQFEQGVVQFGWSSWKMVQTLVVSARICATALFVPPHLARIKLKAHQKCEANQITRSKVSEGKQLLAREFEQ